MKLSQQWVKMRNRRHSVGRRTLALRVEEIESRRLLTAGAGFLAGSVLLDTGGPLSGVTVQVLNPGNPTPVQTQTTDADGQYLFTGLAPGTYLLKEIPPTGFQAAGASAGSQLDPSTVTGADTIQVTVVDPSRVFVNYNGILPGSYEVVNDVVQGNAQVNSVGPQQDTLGTAAGDTSLNAGFHTFCVNDLQSLTFSGPSSYQVTPRPITALTDGTNPVSADHAGRIAYLFNHYGNAPLTSVQGAGLQLAIWELLYDSGNTLDFTSGAFQVLGPDAPFTNAADYAAAVQQAQAYDTESAGHHESAVFLDAGAANPGVTDGLQSVLATGSFNFTLHQTPPCNCCEVDNVSFVINGCTRVTDLRGHVHPGDKVEADFTIPAGHTETLSLVSYTAPQPYFDANTADKQVVFKYDTETLGPGRHSLTVKVPNGDFQVDFVCGTVITHLGPAGTNNFYTPQHRLISADNGGPACHSAPPPCYNGGDHGKDGDHDDNKDCWVVNVGCDQDDRDQDGRGKLLDCLKAWSCH